jgi:beta-xylosidase
MKLKSATLFLLWISIHLSAQPYTAQHSANKHLTDKNPSAGQQPVRQSSARLFTNPVIPGDFADPTVICIEDTYYACGTSSEWAPHYPIFESKDLINWNYIGPAFETKPEWTKGSFWAPELYILNGKIYLYYTARRASDGISYIGVATTDDIRKGFQDHGCLVESGTEAIDAFILEDEGKLYISWKAYGLDSRPIELLCSELSSDGLKLLGEPFTLLKDDEGIGMEGQYIYKEDGYYYIIYSILDCCGANSNYAVSAARSESLRGPYEKYEGNPILQGNDKDILSCGHGTAVKTPDGKMFYLFHAYLKGEGFYNGRQGFLKELAIDEDKWPYFVTGKYASVQEPMLADKIKQNEISNFEDPFEGNEIRPEWTWNFTFSDIRTKTENGTLFLTGTPHTDNKYGTVLCLRTLKPDYEITTEIKDQKDICSGLTLYGDKDNLVILGKENGNILLKQIKKGEETILYQKAVSGNIHLKITVSNGCIASFFQSSDRNNWLPLPISGQDTAGRIVNQKPDVSYLLPWDRVFRSGLIHIGNENIPAEFTYCRLDYK